MTALTSYPTPTEGLQLKPTRRTWLKAVLLALIAAPLVRAGLSWQRRHPRHLSPIPWIGHC